MTRQLVVRPRIQRVTKTPHKASAAMGIQEPFQASSEAETPRPVQRVAIALRLVAAPIRPEENSRKGGPKRGWRLIHLCNRGEERAKHQADRSRKGTVGSSGSAMPANASSSESHPRGRRVQRLAVRA